MKNNRKNETHFSKKWKKPILFIAILLLAIFFYWQNNDIVISRFTYTSEKISESSDGYRFVQISDLHNKSFGKHGKKLIAKVKEEKPEFLLLTGDFIDSGNYDIDTEFIENLVKLAPTYYITGNHETSLAKDDYENVLHTLENAGVTLLLNDVAKLDDQCYLLGLDENTLWATDTQITQTISEIKEANKIPEESLVILLAHEPQLIEAYAASDVDVVFSGHAHGGQFRIPFSDLSFVAPDQGLFPKYTAGEYSKDATTMYVSRGLGNSIIPVRLFNRPEIVTVDVKR